jgi:DUF438 domain-containing protein
VGEINDVVNLPYTITYLIRKRMQIDSWMELPKDKRPPQSIWDKPDELEEWFDRVLGDKGAQTEFNLPVNENEVER